jgi:hypothetical protein
MFNSEPISSTNQQTQKGMTDTQADQSERVEILISVLP